MNKQACWVMVEWMSEWRETHLKYCFSSKTMYLGAIPLQFDQFTPKIFMTDITQLGYNC